MADNLPIHYRGAIEQQAQDFSFAEDGPSPRSAFAAHRERMVLHWRACGFDWDQIRDKMIADGDVDMDFTSQQAKGICDRAIRRIKREAPEQVKVLELKRCDMLTSVYMPKALEGHGPSCDRVLLIMERRAKIEGIDAPVEIDFHAIRQQFFVLLREAIPDSLEGIGSGTELYAIILNHFVEKQRRLK